jgi:hypothetical protein
LSRGEVMMASAGGKGGCAHATLIKTETLSTLARPLGPLGSPALAIITSPLDVDTYLIQLYSCTYLPQRSVLALPFIRVTQGHNYPAGPRTDRRRRRISPQPRRVLAEAAPSHYNGKGHQCGRS